MTDGQSKLYSSVVSKNKRNENIFMLPSNEEINQSKFCIHPRFYIRNPTYQILISNTEYYGISIFIFKDCSNWRILCYITLTKQIIRHLSRDLCFYLHKHTIVKVKIIGFPSLSFSTVPIGEFSVT